MKLDVYTQLLHLNQGFDQIVTSLAALPPSPSLDAGELARLIALSKETRACINASLTAMIETAESAEADRRYHQRRRRERQQEQQT